MGYEVPRAYLERYADLLINFALGGGARDQAPATSVHVVAPGERQAAVRGAVPRGVAGRWPCHRRLPPRRRWAVNLTRDFFEIAGPEQHGFFPASLPPRGWWSRSDHLVYVRCVADPQALPGRGPGEAPRPPAGASVRWSSGRPRRRVRGASPGRSPCTAPRRWPPKPGCRSRSTGRRSSRPAFSISPTRRRAGAGDRPDAWLHRGAQPPADRSAPRPGRGRRSVADPGGAAALDRRRRAQHSQLRDLHQPGLARYRGVDPLQRAAVRATGR